MSPLALALALGLHAPTPAASPSSLDLRWDAPPSCPDREALLRRIDATLGDVALPERPPLTVRGQLRVVEPEGYALRLELDDGHASVRELEGPSCEELTEAAALVIAITMDPRLLERLQEPPAEAAVEPTEGSEPEAVPTPPETQTPVESAPPDPVTSEPAAAEPTPSAPPRASEPLRGLARAHAGIGGGPLPGPSAVVSLAFGLGGRRWRAELTATYWTPQATASPVNPSIGVRAQLWTLGANACLEPSTATLTFPLCTGVLAGALHARGTGQLQPRTVASRWVALALEPGLTWWFRPRLGLAVRTRGHVTLARPALRTDRSGTVFQGAPVGGALLVGLELRLP